ncbi:hypothetical protein N9C10_01670, partial [Flavobacteriaceae bacterium]|nr:hypothetical protein [Flavobacteriaceae bacterium]
MADTFYFACRVKEQGEKGKEAGEQFTNGLRYLTVENAPFLDSDGNMTMQGEFKNKDGEKMSVQGSNGLNGTNGAQGSTGAKGSTGSGGAQGTSGSLGPQGETGLKGSTGSGGAQGTAGSNGS